jgi:PTH1 family peptidyl-tRNA hydrolase
MKVIVGLGNPGKQYRNTRHNVGFMCLDYFASKEGEEFHLNKKLKAEIVKTKDFILVKPQTYMNLSGESLRATKEFYQLNNEDFLVIYDDMDLPFTSLRLREKGGPGGHNGIRSIIQHLGTEEIKRVRIGIGKDPNIDAKSYVLGTFNKEQLKEVQTTSKIVSEIITMFLDNIDFSIIMTHYNKAQ